MSIALVSREAGVSIATVSRVLNENPHVSPAKVLAVRDAIARVGYVPTDESSVGRPRKRPSGIRTGAIAVLFPDCDRLAIRMILSGRLMHGIEEVLGRNSLTMVVTGLQESGALPACIDRRQVDAVIVRGTRRGAPLDESLTKIPGVWLFESDHPVAANFDKVWEDNTTIGRMAVDWLVQRNHRHLAFVNMAPDHPSFLTRGAFFKIHGERVGATVQSFTGHATAGAMVDKLLACEPRVTGLFIPGGDVQVAEVYRALVRRGIRVGHDIDLISCNNDPAHLAAIDPRLANIDIQAEAIGRAAVEMLLWRMRHPREAHRRTIISPILVPGSELH